MTIESYGGDKGTVHVRTTACPFCETPIARQQSLATHLEDCEEAPR